jgi:hypothetical protein
VETPRKSFRDSFAEWLEVVALFAAIGWFAFGTLVLSVGVLEWLIVFLFIVGLNLLAAWLSPARSRLYAMLWRRHATPLRGYEAKDLPRRSPPKP